MILLSDVDGVVLDWRTGYCQFHNYSDEVTTQYDSDPRFELDRIVEFNKSEAFGQLSPMSKSNEVLPALLSIGMQIHFVTSALPACESNADRIGIIHRRISNIEKSAFGTDYSLDNVRYSILPLRGDKVPTYEYLASFDKQTFVVEDHFTTALAVATALPDVHVFIMRQSYNDLPDQVDIVGKTINLSYVADWHEVATKLNAYTKTVKPLMV